jgi:gliding motility-associated-like protein
VADTKNYKIRKIDSLGNVTTIAGAGVFGTTNGPTSIALFGFSCGITVTNDGSTIYVSDYNTHVIRKIYNGVVSNLAGTVFISGSTNGTGTGATFNHPYGLTLDHQGNVLVADEWNHQIRKVTPLGQVTTIAGVGTAGTTDGPSLSAQFNFPTGVCVDSIGNIYISDAVNQTIRKRDVTTGTISTYVGAAGIMGSSDGVGSAARFNNPAGISYNRNDHSLYITDTDNHTIRKVTAISNITLVVSLSKPNTICYGDSINIIVSPANLTNYKVYENGNLVALSLTNIVKLTNLTAGTHILNATAIDANGATASSNFTTITVRPQFIPTITSSAGSTLCNGSSTTLTAQTGTAYLWSTNATTPTISVNNSGSYIVTVTNSNGCKGISSPISITNIALTTPLINPPGPLSVCPGDSVTLSTSSIGSLTWSNGSNLSSIKVPAGNYSVTVSQSGCSATSAIITVSNFVVVPITVNPPGPITLIVGDSILLSASGATNYQWSNGNVTNSTYVSASGIYFVTGDDIHNCKTKSANVQVNSLSGQNNLSASGPLTFCSGSSVTLISAVATGNQWYLNSQIIAGATSQQYTATLSGYYKVSFNLAGNILYSDSLFVNVLSAPSNPIVHDTTICAGNIVLLNVDSNTAPNYRWYDASVGGNLLYTGTNYQTQVLQNTTNYFVAAVGTNICESTSRSQIKVQVITNPKADFNQTVKPSSGTYEVTFNNTSQFADTYKWIFGDTNTTTNISVLDNSVFYYPTTGNYTVILIAYNSNGCVDTLNRTIVVESNTDLFIPTTFTPNGDGKNDVFRVRGGQVTLKEMSIYDQWGTLIYHTDASLPSWDGYAMGSLVQNGTYVYHIELIDRDQVTKNLTGPITVIK